MQITAATLLALQQGFNAAFLQGFGSVKSTRDLIAMTVPSTADIENYGWMKDLPGMREWVGQRQINNLESSAATLKNKSYEHTIAVKRDNIEDDKLGLYTAQEPFVWADFIMARGRALSRVGRGESGLELVATLEALHRQAAMSQGTLYLPAIDAALDRLLQNR